uniref:IFT122 zinc ribbon domain-containing protein n=2 Tax=Clastoptera arizonana TaxID=38151 RepID=A0A1B6CIH7_9HEMI
MQNLKIPPKFQEYFDVASIVIRGKPYRDNEELLIMCYRCSTYNSLLTNSGILGNCCTNCRQPFVFSFVTFEILPLIEFQLEPGITDEEALRLLESCSQEQTDAWSQNLEDNFQTLKLDETTNNIPDNFMAKLVNFESDGDQFEPLTINRSTLQSMDPTTVVICRYPKPLQYRYFKNILSELQVTVCNTCNKIFHIDDFEMKILQNGFCPFCKTVPEIYKFKSDI